MAVGNRQIQQDMKLIYTHTHVIALPENVLEKKVIRIDVLLGIMANQAAKVVAVRRVHMQSFIKIPPETSWHLVPVMLAVRVLHHVMLQKVHIMMIREHLHWIVFVLIQINVR